MGIEEIVVEQDIQFHLETAQGALVHRCYGEIFREPVEGEELVCPGLRFVEILDTGLTISPCFLNMALLPF